MTYTVAIVIPGTTGSQLVTSEDLTNFYNSNEQDQPTIVWPTQVEEWILDVPKAVQLISQSDLVPFRAPGYQPLVSYLAQQLGNCAQATWDGHISLTGGQNQVVTYVYDWRQDNVISAGGPVENATLPHGLRGLLVAIGQAYEGQDYQVFLIGHSMGGLVSRAYIESVGPKSNDDFPIKALITLGTPHLGAPLALDVAMGDRISWLLSPSFLNQVIDNTDFPSTYQLLPPFNSLCPPIITDTSGNSYNPFDTTNNQANQTLLTVLETNYSVSQGNLNAAAAFFGQLNYAPQADVPYYTIYAECNPANDLLGHNGETVTSLTYTPNANKPQDATVTANWTGNNQVGGDNVVPVWSARYDAVAKEIYEAQYASAAAQQSGSAGLNHDQLITSPDAQAQIWSWMQSLGV